MRIVIDSGEMRHSAVRLGATRHEIGMLGSRLSGGLVLGAPPATAAAVGAGILDVRSKLFDVSVALEELQLLLNTRARLTDIADGGLASLLPGARQPPRLPWFDGPANPGIFAPKFWFRGPQYGPGRGERTWERDKKGRWGVVPIKNKPESRIDKDFFAGLKGSKSGLLGVKGHTQGKNGIFSGQADAEAGLRGDIEGKVGYDGHNAVAEAGVGASLGARVSADGHVGNDDIGAGGGGSAFVGARGNAEAGIHAGKDGIGAKGGASAFAGGEAEGHVSSHVSGVSATAGAGVSYGIGAHATGEASIDHGKVHVKTDVGATLGLGGKVSIDVTVDPVRTVKDVGHVASAGLNEVGKYMPHIDPPHLEMPKVKAPWSH